MARENWIHSRSGIPYNWAFDPPAYAEQFARNGNQIQGQLVCEWDDAGDLKADLMESCEYVPGQTWLKRELPLLCPNTETLFLTDMTKVKTFMPKTDDTGYGVQVRDAETGWWGLGRGRIFYRCTFTNLPYKVKKDDDVRSQANPELNRYATVSSNQTSYNRVVTSTRLVLDDLVDGKTVSVPETAAVPEVMTLFTVKQWMWPLDAVNWDAINDRAGKLNDADFTIRGIVNPAETLLYEGLASSVEEYTGADGKKYVDLVHRLTRHPVNFNKTYHGGAWKYFKVADSVPPLRRYQLANFVDVFNPK